MNSLPPLLADLFAWLEQTSFAEAIRLTPRLYPILMSVHVIGIALLLGPALAVDLRLLGVGRKTISVTVALRLLLPISHVGFAVVAITGVLMFTAVALTVGASAAAPWKLGLIALAGINILVFHNGVYRSVEGWDVDRASPALAKAAAIVSASA